jgi:hypothetical protein
MRVGSIVSEKLAVSLFHPERGGNMHFRNIGRPRSLQHEVSIVKAAAYDFTQFVWTKKRAAPQIWQLDCSCTHNNHYGLQQPDINTRNQPFTAATDYGSPFESLGPETLRFSPDTCTFSPAKSIGLLDPEGEAQRTLETLGASPSTTRCHIPQGLNMLYIQA